MSDLSNEEAKAALDLIRQAGINNREQLNAIEEGNLATGSVLTAAMASQAIVRAVQASTSGQGGNLLDPLSRSGGA